MMEHSIAYCVEGTQKRETIIQKTKPYINKGNEKNHTISIQLL